MSEDGTPSAVRRRLHRPRRTKVASLLVAVASAATLIGCSTTASASRSDIPGRRAPLPRALRQPDEGPAAAMIASLRTARASFSPS